ncbi:hypothetical protein, partial [Anaerostipes caccae]|uniref:hypothetical protein n=1 Tax=Anaerostipes caccae TaxID=105841 RepID=UPI001A934D2E
MYIAEALEKLDPFGFQTEIRRKLTEKPGHSHGMLMDFRILILSRLVDTISSRILHPMLLLVENHSIAVVLPLGEVLHSLNR